MASTKIEVNSTWTAPRTWTAGELVTASMMNGLRDQLNALKTPAWGMAYIDEAADYSTTSTSFVDVDAAGTSLTLTVTTGGGNMMVVFAGSAQCSPAGNTGYFGLSIDGVDVANDGVVAFATTTTAHPQNVSFTWLLTELSAGSHTVILRYKTSGGTLTLHAGAGTAGRDLHPQLWVEEI